MNLDQQLHELADRIVPPDVPVFEDLDRGRRRVRRHRASVAASLATAAVVGGVAWLAVPFDGAGDGAPADDPTSTPSIDPAPVDRELRLVPPPRGDVWEPDNLETLLAWRAVLAEHLDPGGTHLEKRPSNEQTGGGESADSRSLGTKLSWTTPGQQGMGKVQISVASAPDATYSWCEDPGWTCRAATAPGGLPARLGTDGSVREVTVTHEDGTIVMLTVDALFGNNSTVPVDDIALTEAQLLAAAADPRLALPEEIAQDAIFEPAAIPARLLERTARELLITDAARFQVEEGSAAGYVYGAVRQGGKPHGDLMLSVDPVASTTPKICQRDVFTRCVERTVDGKRVFIGWLDPAVNDGAGGWNVEYVGPTHVTFVGYFPRNGGVVSLDAAVELVLRPALQQSSR